MIANNSEGRFAECAACGKQKWIPADSDKCGGCRFKRVSGTVHNLTLDITLFLTLVRGISLEEASALQQLNARQLREHMEKNRNTVLYSKLTQYYTALRAKREARKKNGEE